VVGGGPWNIGFEGPATAFVGCPDNWGLEGPTKALGGT